MALTPEIVSRLENTQIDWCHPVHNQVGVLWSAGRKRLWIQVVYQAMPFGIQLESESGGRTAGYPLGKRSSGNWPINSIEASFGPQESPLSCPRSTWETEAAGKTVLCPQSDLAIA